MIDRIRQYVATYRALPKAGPLSRKRLSSRLRAARFVLQGKPVVFGATITPQGIVVDDGAGLLNCAVHGELDTEIPDVDWFTNRHDGGDWPR